LDDALPDRVASFGDGLGVESSILAPDRPVLGVLANGIEATGSQTVRTIADRPLRNCLPACRIAALASSNPS
jgi:hypothetical protein